MPQPGANWDTMAHEVLDHAKESIKSYYGVPSRSEDSAWLTGYLMRVVVTIFGMPCGQSRFTESRLTPL